ncbi:MAG: type II restriction endonuclease subunit M, partial [Bacteroidaceae bacterium]|nr:type II restriction endonuclease subunit M [Bacteroidaceae bacterium]
NEVINQLADAYMTYVEKKPAPDQYRDELQKVKAYIATHNVYGVDLNPTAIELGKLSLWLNVIHKDMETPFFANRLGVGNAVIGAWLKVYDLKDVVSVRDYGRKTFKVRREWWTVAPHKVKFFKNRVNRSVNEVYHFLLPDKGMLAALGIAEMKRAHPIEARRMTERRSQWTEAIDANMFRQLLRISAKIDVLLREAMETQVSIERLTTSKRDIWPHEQEASFTRKFEQADDFAEKERIFNTRYRRDNAYYKLKLVMDYWCALWFWEYEDAASLPTREEYWQEIENLLDVDDSKLDSNTRRTLERGATGIVSDQLPFEYESVRMTEEEAEIVTKSKEEILLGTKAQMSLFDEFEPARFKIAKRLADRYHFFHPML